MAPNTGINIMKKAKFGALEGVASTESINAIFTGAGVGGNYKFENLSGATVTP